MECFSFSVLLKYLQGQEDSGEHTIIFAHLSDGCQICHENLQWLGMVISSAADDQSFEFSEEMLAAIVARFKAGAATALQPIRQYIAELISDKLLLPQFADTRPKSKEASGRESLYHVEGYDIDLLFVVSSKENNNERLIGQVLPERWDATGPKQFKVELLQDGSVVSVADTTTHGEFMFAQLTAGIYDLKVSIPGGEINLERVLSARAS